MDPRNRVFGYLPTQQPIQPNQYISPYYDPQLFEQIQTPHSGPQFQYDQDYVTHGPVVHEGFIPSNNFDDFDDIEDEGAYPVLPLQLQSSFVGFNPQASLLQRDTLGGLEEEEEEEEDEDESESEIDPITDEQFLSSIPDFNNPDVDPDYAMSDAEHVSQDEMLIDESLQEVPRPRRGRPPGSGKGKGRRGRPPKESHPKPRGRRRETAPKGEGQRGGVRGRKGPRAVADPGPEFKNLQNRASDAYVEKNYQAAIDYANKAIQLNPEIFATHSLLSEIHLEMGDMQRSLEALIVGAPTKRDKNLWFHIIERIWDLEEDKYPLYNRGVKIALALSCLKEILLMDPNDYEAREQKLKIEVELGNNGKAISLCAKMLEIRPSETEVLREMARLSTKSGRHAAKYLDKVLNSFESTFTYFTKNESPATSNFDWSLLNYYLELLERVKNYDKALASLKVLSRWLLGRKEATYWDSQQDDREWDVEDEPRRIGVNGFTPGEYPKETYGEGIPLEIRVKMGVYRLHMGPSHLAEALKHFEFLEPDDESPDAKVMDYGDLFREAADTFKSLGYHQEAIRFYEALQRNPDEMNVAYYLGLAVCYTALRRTSDAAECLQTVMNTDMQNVEDLVQLAKFLEDFGMKEAAIRKGREVFKLGRLDLLRKAGFKSIAAVQPVFPPKKPVFKNEDRKNNPRSTPRRIAPRPAPRRGSNSALDLDEDSDEALSSTNGHAAGQSLERSNSCGRPSGPRKSGKQTSSSFESSFIRTFQPVDEPQFSKSATVMHRLNQATAKRPVEMQTAKDTDLRIKEQFKTMKELEEAIRTGDHLATEEWMNAASEMTDEFVKFKLFFMDRNLPFTGYFRRRGDWWKDAAITELASFANKIDSGDHDLDAELDDVADEFHDISFEEWFDIFCSYATQLAKAGNSERCFKILDAACKANVFFTERDRLHRIYVCWLACAITLNDAEQVCYACRWFMKHYPFDSDLFRLYNICNRLCSGPNGWYNSGPAQKAILRYVKAMDFALLTPEQRKWYKFNATERSSWTTRIVNDGLMHKIKSHDPTLFALYGHVLVAAGTYTSALNYYFRAYVITPDDPILNLSIALCYIQHAMKRQSENRQYQIQQGLAFLFRYYELRTKDNAAVHLQEAEFNVGRAWHALGLTHLALPAYERCIELSGRVREEQRSQGNGEVEAVEDFAAEASFAIQTMLALTGDFEGARNATERGLVIE